MAKRSVVIAAPRRTAIGTFGGSLKDIPAPELAAAAISASLQAAGVAPDRVENVVFGNVIQAGVKMNPARQASIKAGLPVTVPAMTVNRVCGSGAQAIVTAAQDIELGHSEIAVAGGMENMDQAPYMLPRARWGQRLGDGQVFDAIGRDGLNDAFSDKPSGWHAEDLATRFQIGRAAQDEFAARSQQRFAANQAKFVSEIVPIEVPGRKGPTIFAADEHNRPDTTPETLARLKPAFRPDGTITAGNAPGINAGAAAMVLAEEGAAAKLGVTPLARLVSYGIGAVEPDYFGLGPVPAVNQALARAGWKIGDIERAEINEAFAVVALVVAQELGLPLDLVNPEGGAIAHGHPIGATGAILTTRLIHAMQRDGLKRGLVTLCIGGGQGIALALESLR
jgi:acetyl-CoA C-acetyltransferase